MEIELTVPLELDEKELATLDLHSFLNVVNVLATDLLFLQDRLGDALEPALTGAYQLADAMRDGVDMRQALAILDAYRELFFATLEKALSQSPVATDSEVVSQVENLRSIWQIIDIRYAEMKARVEVPAEWRSFSARQLTQEFQNFLGAVEKNSHGRYHIVSNIARKEPSDYVVYLDFSGFEGDTIVMPPVIKDVFRDLLANARKYTDPGGTIEAGISCNQDMLRPS
jgi:signal transduction histidine kinase